MRPLVQEPIRDRVKRHVFPGSVCGQAHVVQRLRGGAAVGGVGIDVRGGDCRRDGKPPCRGDVPHETCGAISAGIQLNQRVISRAGVRRQLAPGGDGGVPVSVCRRRTACLECRQTSSRRAQSCPPRAPASMDILQTVMRPSIDKDRMASPVYSTA